MAVAEARQDIDLQKRFDVNRDPGQDVLAARIAAVVGAQDALASGALGSRWALRQSLIDLAAVAELLAAEMPAPTAGR